MRELCIQFSRYLSADPACLPADAPPWTLDLVRYEAAVMEAVIAEDPPPSSELVALSMELPVALSTTQRFLRLSWSVHLPEATTERACAIAVYRGPSDAVEALERSLPSRATSSRLCTRPVARWGRRFATPSNITTSKWTTASTRASRGSSAT